MECKDILLFVVSIAVIVLLQYMSMIMVGGNHNIVINVRDMDDTLHTVELSSDSKVQDILQYLKLDPLQVSLGFQGQPLSLGTSLADAGIGPESTVQIAPSIYIHIITPDGADSYMKKAVYDIEQRREPYHIISDSDIDLGSSARNRFLLDNIDAGKEVIVMTTGKMVAIEHIHRKTGTAALTWFQ